MTYTPKEILEVIDNAIQSIDVELGGDSVHTEERSFTLGPFLQLAIDFTVVTERGTTISGNYYQGKQEWHPPSHHVEFNYIYLFVGDEDVITKENYTEIAKHLEQKINIT